MATQAEMAAARRLIAETSYEYGNHPESARSALEAAAEAGGGGWLNGTVILKGGRAFTAGGGWLDLFGLVEPYNYRDAGQVDELAEAIGLDIEDTLALLSDDCPTFWEMDGPRIGARVEGGDGEDYDTGTVIEATGFELSDSMAGGGNVLVAWDGGTRTWVPAADLCVI